MFIIYCVYVISVQRRTIEEVNTLYGELQAVNAQLTEYADMSEKMAQTKERNRLAREIHDTLGHTPGECVAVDDKSRILFIGDACNCNYLLGENIADTLEESADVAIKGLEKIWGRSCHFGSFFFTLSRTISSLPI